MAGKAVYNLGSSSLLYVHYFQMVYKHALGVSVNLHVCITSINQMHMRRIIVLYLPHLILHVNQVQHILCEEGKYLH